MRQTVGWIIFLLGGILIGMGMNLPLRAPTSRSTVLPATPFPDTFWTEKATELAQDAVVSIRVQSYVTIEDFFFNIRQVPRKSEGSGVIIDSRGYILTNNHVVKEAEEITVTLLDGRTFDGKIVGRDPDTDVAVVKISADNLPVACIGDSNQLKKGQLVLAIGNPFGLESTVTLGIISGFERDIQVDEHTRIERLIQTDAAINPGNSGGPLVDSRGCVVGINTAIIPPTQGQGISFAIPINDAMDVAKQLIAQGKVLRPWLGIILEEVSISPQWAKQLSLPRRLLVIDDMYKNSPAHLAGVNIGDVLIRINGISVQTVDDAKQIIRQSKVGDIITLTIFRYPRQEHLIFRIRLREKPLDVYGI
ncbi:MAG: S1C family serine protease [bacterium JZ-2024 1]